MCPVRHLWILSFLALLSVLSLGWLERSPAARRTPEPDSSGLSRLLSHGLVPYRSLPEGRHQVEPTDPAADSEGAAMVFIFHPPDGGAPRFYYSRGGEIEQDLSAVIESEAARHGLDPRLVELVIRHESNFDPYAHSPAGAQGLMQLMPETAAALGVSDPFDPAQNVAGGTSYLAAQIERFGDVRLALAAYNAGPGAVLQHGGVPPYAETQNYVASIWRDYTGEP
ncbi:lytic transglycosylase domain-containing protein [bacterium CPR1]|nr:lytic transglycosylase domain-containing protein [bacterium CPR1]